VSLKEILKEYYSRHFIHLVVGLSLVSVVMQNSKGCIKNSISFVLDKTLQFILEDIFSVSCFKPLIEDRCLPFNALFGMKVVLFILQLAVIFKH
jgi:hypothetical protein